MGELWVPYRADLVWQVVSYIQILFVMANIVKLTGPTPRRQTSGNVCEFLDWVTRVGESTLI